MSEVEGRFSKGGKKVRESLPLPLRFRFLSAAGCNRQTPVAQFRQQFQFLADRQLRTWL